MNAHTITIEKGLPVPRRAGGPGRNAIYPFAEMEVGDSFAVPLTGTMIARGDRDKATNRLMAAVWRFSERHGKEFIVRTLREEGVVRVWRVA